MQVINWHWIAVVMIWSSLVVDIEESCGKEGSVSGGCTGWRSCSSGSCGVLRVLSAH